MGPVFRHCPCFRPAREEVRVLDYAHCSLEEVPTEVFNHERTLEELYLNANQIKELPRPLFHCHGLRKLNVSDNDIQQLPPAIASLISLEELDISKNNVMEIPDNINGCKCLSIVEASVNPVGKLPDGFTQLINIEQLYLNDTFLEYLPANFGRLSKLKILELRENHLKVLPKSMARLTELSRLDIGQNDFVEMPEVIGSLPSLTELWCDNNQITALPSYLGNLVKLTYLDASHNKISYIAEEIENLVRLTDFTLSSNRLQKLPDTMGGLQRLTTLRLDDNHLSTLPDSIGQLDKLEELVVGRNRIDSLPSTMGLLRSLAILIADDNAMEDLPPEIGSCQKLRILSLRDNRLMNVPDELGHLSSLRVVNLSGNQLRHLPVSLAKLGSLHALWLSENQTKPLVLLQSDVDYETGQRVLTCFLLPQESSMYRAKPDVVEDGGNATGGERRGTITFACDVDIDRPRRLVRLPTPYPKELKARARHTRNLYRQSNGSIGGQAIMAQPTSRIDDFPSEGRVSDKTPDVQVKEAKVVRPVSSGSPDHLLLNSEKHGVNHQDAITPNTKLFQQCLVSTNNCIPPPNMDIERPKPVASTLYGISPHASRSTPPPQRQHRTSVRMPYPENPAVLRETLSCINEHSTAMESMPRLHQHHHHEPLPPPNIPHHPPTDHPLHPQHRSPNFHNVVAQLNERFRTLPGETGGDPPGYQSDHETYVHPPKTFPCHDGYSSDMDSVMTIRRHPVPYRGAPLDVVPKNRSPLTYSPARFQRHLHPVRDSRVVSLPSHDGTWLKVGGDAMYPLAGPVRDDPACLLPQQRSNLRTSKDGYSLPLDRRNREDTADSCP